MIRDLREEWGIVDEEPDEGDEDVENNDDAVVMQVGNMMLIVTCLLYTSNTWNGPSRMVRAICWNTQNESKEDFP